MDSPDDVLVVMVQLIQAGHDVAHAQLVLGVLEQAVVTLEFVSFFNIWVE